MEREKPWEAEIIKYNTVNLVLGYLTLGIQPFIDDPLLMNLYLVMLITIITILTGFVFLRVSYKYRATMRKQEKKSYYLYQLFGLIAIFLGTIIVITIFNLQSMQASLQAVYRVSWPDIVYPDGSYSVSFTVFFLLLSAFLAGFLFVAEGILILHKNYLLIFLKMNNYLMLL